MSSTAIVLQQLTQQDELNRTHGRLAFGTLLFQDLAVVPFLALAGVLASTGGAGPTPGITLTIVKAAIALVIVLGLVALAGFLLCVIGAVITIPIASAALMYVYEDLFGTRAVGVVPE